MTTKELTSLIIEDIIAEIPIQMDGDEQGIREEMSALIYSHVERYRQQMVDKACEWWRAELDVDVDETYQSWIDETLSRFLKAMLNENQE